VKLKKEVPAGRVDVENIQTIDLPNQGEGFPSDGTQCVMAGWGCNSGGKMSSVHGPFSITTIHHCILIKIHRSLSVGLHVLNHAHIDADRYKIYPPLIARLGIEPLLQT
jgi:hypothetical protein